MLGGSILIMYSSLYNWNILEDLTKLLFLSGTLIFIIFFSYNYINIKNNKQVKLKQKIFMKNKIRID